MCAEFIALNHQLMALLVTRLPKGSAKKIRKPLFYQQDQIAITGNDSSKAVIPFVCLYLVKVCLSIMCVTGHQLK